MSERFTRPVRPALSELPVQLSEEDEHRNKLDWEQRIDDAGATDDWSDPVLYPTAVPAQEI